MSKVLVFIKLLLFFCGLSLRAADIGVNLEGVKDYARNFMFVDAIKSARKFGSVEKPWEGEVSLGGDGWPTQNFGIVVMAGQEGIEGDYQLFFDGKAIVSLVASSGSISKLNYDPKNKKSSAVLTVNPGATQLMLSFKDTQGEVKNIRLFRPGFNSKSKSNFNPKFLSLLKPFSTLRYMDLLQTNGNTVEKWKDRSLPSDPLQSSSKGVAWEYLIELANESKKDIWINIPYLADDNYVQSLALLLKSSLNQSSKVYLELANEIWNGIFLAKKQNAERALMEASLPGSLLKFEGEVPNLRLEEWRQVPKRLLEVVAIFEKHFGVMNRERVRPVLASQIAYPDIIEEQLSFIEKKIGPPKNYLYAIAGAPYFGFPKQTKSLPVVSVKDMVEILKNTIQTKTFGQFKGRYRELSKQYGLKFIAYEGGPDTAGDWELRNKIVLNQSKEMGELLEMYFKNWFACNDELFMYYNLTGAQTKHGSWGLYETLDKPSEKASAVQRVLSQKVKPSSQICK